MSNPFDQFATELSSALPGGGAPAPVDDSNPFSFAPPTPGPPPSDKPVMNSAPMNNGYGGYGQPPMGQPPMYGGMAQPPMYGGMGMGQPPSMNGMGGPPPGGMGMNGLAPPAPPLAGPPPGGDPFSGYGAPAAPEPQSNPFGGPPAPVSSDPFSAYGQPGPGQAPPTPNPYGGGPPGPPPQQAPPTAPATPNPYGQPPMGGMGGDPFASAYGAPPSSENTFALALPTPATPNPAYGAPPAAPGNYGFAGAALDQYGGGYGQPPAPPLAGPDQYGGGYGQPPAPPSAAPDQYGGGYGQPPAPPSAAPDQYGGGYGQPPAPPSADPFGGYGQPPAASGPPPNPYGGYGQPAPAPQNPYGAPPSGYGDPFGGDPNQGALVVSQQQSNPYGMPPQQMQPPPPAVDPFSVFNQAPAPPPAPPAQYHAPPSQALVPAQAPPSQYAQQAPPPAGDSGDLWSDLGFDPPPTQIVAHTGGKEAHQEEEKKDNGELPSGGEFYDARIFTPTLGVMFFKPQELTDSLFLNTDRSLVDGLGERPVVAFIVEGSSARSAGVELGHVLLKVNGVDVKNPKEASRLIKEGPRPLPLMFYVPNTEVVVAEGEHMVKYDTRETTAPNSAKDWKPKYVVIGGIIAQPWMMNMYRSKSEYDIAVIETQARRPVSVKVKQFSLQGARIQNDWQGPQMVKYKNKLHPWKYIVVLPVARNPIKISSPNLASLKPVHEGIRRVLLAQQRGRGGNPHTAAPVRSEESYARPTSHSDPYGGRAPPPHSHPPPEAHYAQQQPQYSHGGY